jgi:hypothetical protein
MVASDSLYRVNVALWPVALYIGFTLTSKISDNVSRCGKRPRWCWRQRAYAAGLLYQAWHALLLYKAQVFLSDSCWLWGRLRRQYQV